MNIIKNVNFGLKEIVNSESATKVMKNYGGQTLKVTGILVGTKDDADEDGVVKTIKVAVLKTADELISSISPTVVNSAETIVSAYEGANLLSEIEAGIDVTVVKGKSAKGREFFFLTI